MGAFRIVLLGLTVLLLAALGWRMTVRMPQAAPPVASTEQMASPPPAVSPAPAPNAPTPAAVRAKLEAALEAAPDLAKVFAALRNEFPGIAEAALAHEVARGQQREASSPDDLVTGALRALRQSSGVLAAKAGADKLGATFDARAAILDKLAQGDPRVCADYWFGGTSPEYADFAAGHRGLEAQDALASIAATAEGKALNQDHGAPTADDFKLIEDQLQARKLSTEEIDFLLDGKSPEPPLSDDKVCADGRAYFDVLKHLPDDVRLRIYSLMTEAWARS